MILVKILLSSVTNLMFIKMTMDYAIIIVVQVEKVQSDGGALKSVLSSKNLFYLPKTTTSIKI